MWACVFDCLRVRARARACTRVVRACVLTCMSRFQDCDSESSNSSQLFASRTPSQPQVCIIYGDCDAVVGSGGVGCRGGTGGGDSGTCGGDGSSEATNPKK